VTENIADTIFYEDQFETVCRSYGSLAVSRNTELSAGADIADFPSR